MKIAPLALCGLIALLAACEVPQPRSAGEHAAPAATVRAQGAPYRIDTPRSELRVLVYRAGALANLGHNHVIVNRAMTGSAAVSPALTGSTFAMSIPVAAFSVDETALRAAEGVDFPGSIPDDAKSGTLRNMLGTALLDAARYPTIEVRGHAAGDASGLTATLEASIAGHVSTLTVPLTVQRESGELRVTGSVAVRQTDLGLTPFSTMLGALQVQDEVRIKFSVVAVPAG